MSAKQQQEEFARQLARLFTILIPYSDDGGELFWHLAHHPQTGHHAILLNEVKEKIKALKLPRHYSYRSILVHVNRVEDAVLECEFFSNIIDFGSFLES